MNLYHSYVRIFVCNLKNLLKRMKFKLRIFNIIVLMLIVSISFNSTIFFNRFIKKHVYKHEINTKLENRVNSCENKHKNQEQLDSQRMINLKRVHLVDCFAIMEGDEDEIRRAVDMTETNQYEFEENSIWSADTDLMSALENCDFFRKKSTYDYYEVTSRELEFPIAYSIVFHDNTVQLERLLRNIYRKHNVYCIHVDLKVSKQKLTAVQSLVRCFDNVFISRERVDVVYASFNRLQADLICMSELLEFKMKWKYVINLTGQMFPLKTNLEIVRILESLKGSNDIESFSWGYALRYIGRYSNIFEIINGSLEKTENPKQPPPFQLKLLKGSAFGCFKRAFVRFVLTNSRVKVFLRWLQDVYSPDEFFWATVNNRLINPIFNAPGGYDRASERVPWFSTYVRWAPPNDCKGVIVRSMCVFGIGDLQVLVHQEHLFANKFYINFQTFTLDCLEEWLHNKTIYKPLLPMHIYRNYRYFL